MKSVILRAAVLPLLSIILWVTAGCSAAAEDPAVEMMAQTAATTDLKPLTQDYITDVAARRMGDAKLVRNVAITGQPDAKVIVVDLMRPSVCHDGAVVGTITTFSQNFMKFFFKYPDVSRIEVTMYGATQDVSSNNEIAVSMAIDRETAGTIDWFGLNDLNVQNLADSFYIDQRVLANWKVDGGGSTPRTQTQTAAASAAT